MTKRAFNFWWPYAKEVEGGYVNDPDDRGGATNMGVTIGTAQTLAQSNNRWHNLLDKNQNGSIDADDIRQLTEPDAKKIAYEVFWQQYQIDKFQDPYIAALFLDSVWGSGYYGPKWLFEGLGISIHYQANSQGVPWYKQSGYHRAIAQVNKRRPNHTLRQLIAIRRSNFDSIARRNPSQYKFLSGWQRRMDTFERYVATHRQSQQMLYGSLAGLSLLGVALMPILLKP